MGTQQILLIVLSVIIVGIAVAVGITMFNQQAVNSNRNACIADMNNFAAQAMAWYRTPVTHGGAGNTIPSSGALVSIGNWIGFDFDNTDTISSGNGTFVMSLGGTGDAQYLQFKSEGTENEVEPALRVVFKTGVNKVAVDGTNFPS